MSLQRPRRIFAGPSRRSRKAGPAFGMILVGGAAVLLAGAGGGAYAWSRLRHMPGTAPVASSAPPTMGAPPAQVAVVDGETLRLRHTVVRLMGVRAPSRGQRCTNSKGHSFDCGAASAEALAVLVHDRGVACDPRGQDRFGRIVAVCTASGEAGAGALNRAVVADGWARANKAWPELAHAEQRARSRRLGIWAGTLPSS